MEQIDTFLIKKTKTETAFSNVNVIVAIKDTS